MAILIVVCFLVGGCATICSKMSPGQVEKVRTTMVKIQGVYHNIVLALKVNPDPRVRLAVVAADIALAALGEMLETNCINQGALANAEIAADQVVEVAKEEGLSGN